MLTEEQLDNLNKGFNKTTGSVKEKNAKTLGRWLNNSQRKQETEQYKATPEGKSFLEKFEETSGKIVGGVFKGLASTATGMTKFLSYALPTGIKEQEKERKGIEEFRETLQPQDTAEKIGFYGEQLAEFLVPITRVKNVGLAKKMAQEAIEFGTRLSVQEGEPKPSGFILGGLMPAITKPISGFFKSIYGATRETLKSVLRATTSVPEKAISRAAKEGGVVRAGFGKGVTATTIQDEAAEAFNILKKANQKAFDEGLESLRKLTPRVGAARTEKGTFSAVKSQFEDFMEKRTEEGLPKIFRDFRISVSKDKLDFDKLNSAIVNTTERGQIQKVFDTLKNQKDFSVKGTQDVAARINALSKFETPKGDQTSAVVASIHSAYNKAIRTVYPELAKLRSEYTTMKGILRNADTILNATKGKSNIKAVRSSVAKLTNLFREDNDIYINALKTLEESTGIKFLSKLAGTEFQRISPGILRTSLAVGGIGAFSYFNPLALLLLPIFSPRAVGGAITRVSQAKALMGTLLDIGIAKKLTSQEVRFIIDKLISGAVDDEENKQD